MIEAGEVAYNVGSQGKHAVFREALQVLGSDDAGVDSALGKSQCDEFLFETRSGEDAVDALEKGALLAVVKRPVNITDLLNSPSLLGKASQPVQMMVEFSFPVLGPNSPRVLRREKEAGLDRVSVSFVVKLSRQ